MLPWGEAIHHRMEQLRSSGVNMVFAGLIKKVVELKSTTSLLALIALPGSYPGFARIIEPAGGTTKVSQGIDNTSRLLLR